MRVYVLLFNARTENEGIHTLRRVDPERGEIDVVLMFEDEDDATRFGVLLEAQDFPTPTVEGMDEEEIREFCESVGYDCRIIPKGALEMPPETNVPSEQMTWNPDGSPSSPADRPDLEALEAEPDPELNRVRAQLEKLLGQS